MLRSSWASLDLIQKSNYSCVQECRTGSQGTCTMLDPIPKGLMRQTCSLTRCRPCRGSSRR